MEYELENITNVPEWNYCFNLLLDPDVSEIETNGPNEFFMKKKGQRIKVEIGTKSEEAYFDGIENGLVPFVKSSNYFKRDAFLYEGRLEFTAGGIDVKGRCHIVLPPTSDTPQITIAKKTTSLVTLEAIASKGSMSTEMMQFIELLVKANQTIAFSGGTGAGKTTMLEAVAKNIPPHLRIGVAEDTPELVLTQPNVSYLHSVPWQPGTSANDVATLSWVVQQFQRMRTDKIVVGEVRGKEFADFLVAANSGMDGSFITIHSDDPVSCLRKMTNFATEARPGVPIRAINTDIATAVNIIVQLIILPDGRHRVSHISEVVPVLGAQEDAKITQEALYEYDRETDTFFKRANVGDELRKKLTSRGFDITRFLNSEREKRVKSHGASSAVTGGPSAAVSSNPAATTRTIGNTPAQQQQRPSGRLPSFKPFGNQGGGRNI